jgi:hypothetical protein
MSVIIDHTEFAGFLEAFDSVGMKIGYYLVSNGLKSDCIWFYVVAYFQGRDFTKQRLKAVASRQDLQELEEKGFIRVDRIVVA